MQVNSLKAKKSAFFRIPYKLTQFITFKQVFETKNTT